MIRWCHGLASMPKTYTNSTQVFDLKIWLIIIILPGQWAIHGINFDLGPGQGELDPMGVGYEHSRVLVAKPWTLGPHWLLSLIHKLQSDHGSHEPTENIQLGFVFRKKRRLEQKMLNLALGIMIWIHLAGMEWWKNFPRDPPTDIPSSKMKRYDTKAFQFRKTPHILNLKSL